MKQHPEILLDAWTQLLVLLHYHANSLAQSQGEFGPMLPAILPCNSRAWLETGQAPILSLVGATLLWHKEVWMQKCRPPCLEMVHGTLGALWQTQPIFTSIYPEVIFSAKKRFAGKI